MNGPFDELSLLKQGAHRHARLRRTQKHVHLCYVLRIPFYLNSETDLSRACMPSANRRMSAKKSPKNGDEGASSV